MDTRRAAAIAGMAGPALFAAIFTVEGLLRPGYRPLAMFVSELSLGPRGWIQIASFILYGASFLVFARGMTRELRGAGASMLWGFGAALILAGVFVMDPNGTPPPERTIHGRVHGLSGAYVFLGWPVCLFLLARAFRKDPAWRPYAAPTLLAALVTAVLLVALTYASQEIQSGRSVPGLQVGLIQRAHIFTWLAWQFGAARRLRAPTA